MDFLVHFFRDILDGPLYWIVVAICFFLIVFIIGFLLDRHEKNERLRGMVQEASAGKERMYVTDEMTKVEDTPTPLVITPPTVEVPNTSEEENKSVGILELSSEDYQENSEVLPDNNNN